jgi:hypothetical protein
MLVISKIDLGIEYLETSKESEEKIDSRSIMNIPVRIKNGNDHPTLCDTVYKGADFRMHEQLYSKIKKNNQ